MSPKIRVKWICAPPHKKSMHEVQQMAEGGQAEGCGSFQTDTKTEVCRWRSVPENACRQTGDGAQGHKRLTVQTYRPHSKALRFATNQENILRGILLSQKRQHAEKWGILTHS